MTQHRLPRRLVPSSWPARCSARPARRRRRRRRRRRPPRRRRAAEGLTRRRRPRRRATTYADLVFAAYTRRHHRGRGPAGRARRLRRRPHRGHPRRGQAGVARRPRAVRAHRGLPLLRRPDRQPRRRARGPDQRLAARRGLHRLRRGRRRRRHHQRRRGVPEITTDVLVAANEEGGETNISTGWHAIEFLLWGQDLSADGAGARPLTDYTTVARPPSAGPPTSRSSASCSSTTSAGVRDQWDPEDGTYRATFLADPDQAVADIFRSMGALSQGELAGERIAVAYDTKDQEDEHSCFSDNTTADIAGNADRRPDVYLGRLPRHRRPVAVRGRRRGRARRSTPPCAPQLDDNVDRGRGPRGARSTSSSTVRTTPRARWRSLELITGLQDQGDTSPSWPARSAYSISLADLGHAVRRPSLAARDGRRPRSCVACSASDGGRAAAGPAAAASSPRRAATPPSTSPAGRLRPARARPRRRAAHAPSRSATTSSTTTG